MAKMSIYEKLQTCRCELQDMDILFLRQGAPEDEQQQTEPRRRTTRAAAKTPAEKVKAVAEKVATRNPKLSDVNRTLLKDKVLGLRKAFPGQNTDAMVEDGIKMKLADVTDETVAMAVQYIDVLMGTAKE